MARLGMVGMGMMAADGNINIEHGGCGIGFKMPT